MRTARIIQWSCWKYDVEAGWSPTLLTDLVVHTNFRWYWRSLAGLLSPAQGCRKHDSVLTLSGFLLLFTVTLLLGSLFSLFVCLPSSSIFLVSVFVIFIYLWYYTVSPPGCLWSSREEQLLAWSFRSAGIRRHVTGYFVLDVSRQRHGIIFKGCKFLVLVVVLSARKSATSTSSNVINPLNTKRRPLYLKTQFVPRSKHFSFRL